VAGDRRLKDDRRGLAGSVQVAVISRLGERVGIVEPARVMLNASAAIS
jgi:hypothetical protein